MSDWWFDDDEPQGDDDAWRLLTDVDAEAVLGIKAVTIRSWKNRGKIKPFDRDSLGRAVYAQCELLAVANRKRR